LGFWVVVVGWRMQLGLFGLVRVFSIPPYLKRVHCAVFCVFFLSNSENAYMYGIFLETARKVEIYCLIVFCLCVLIVLAVTSCLEEQTRKLLVLRQEKRAR
jgi:hypothetical protein